MLLSINLQQSELTFVDAEHQIASLLPSGSTELTASFADQLQQGLDVAPGLNLLNGQDLPEGGNSLPPGVEVSQATTDLLSLPFPEEHATGVADELPADPSLALAWLTPASTQAAESPFRKIDLPGSSAAKTTAAPLQPALPRSEAMATESAALRLLTEDTSLSPVKSVADESSDPAARLPVADLRNSLLSSAALRPQQATEPSGKPNLSAGLEMPSLTTIHSSAVTVVTSPQAEIAALSAADGGNQESLPQLTSVTGNLHASSSTVQTASQQVSTEPLTAAAINTPVHDAKWGERIAERVLLLANNKLQNVEIRLTPAELGPLRVTIAVDDGATNVTFHAQHSATREAIEQALPRLRELLAENGLTLGQASVSEQGVQHGHRDADRGTATERDAGTGDAGDVEREDALQRPQLLARSNGLVDTFA